MTIRIVLVDDQELVRAGFAMMVSAQPDMEVVGQAGDGRRALEVLASVEADVVVMDLRMPVMDGVEATRALQERDQPPKVLALTTFDTDEDAFAALQAGASAFLLKNSPPGELLSAIRIVAAGESVVAPRVTRRLLDRFAGNLAPDNRGEKRYEVLTERELEVLRLVAEGLSNKEIAERLFVSESTVKSHFGRVLMKLGLRDRVHAVVFAYETGLVRPPN
ncbi:two component transcriptional regulator, LuxR family [Lentzea xinjiangensis]|uniref:Two component transcriptional regulator, LuxR family n=1 Tax=Lentzea xinjiangensis TaxID=402600 RepID=A0A1H9NLL4_9PSEU|nr:response regulator transcription factor [Lentzea xinjiangensis]SER36647.1 two component transcriptional regulator, LuxR family [Lentzea xinjiangensis]